MSRFLTVKVQICLRKKVMLRTCGAEIPAGTASRVYVRSERRPNPQAAVNQESEGAVLDTAAEAIGYLPYSQVSIDSISGGDGPGPKQEALEQQKTSKTRPSPSDDAQKSLTPLKLSYAS